MTLQQVKQVFRKLKIQKVKLGVFDIDGILRGKYVSLEKFFSAAESGLGFCDVIFGWDSSDALYDSVTFTGWHSGYPDALAKIDLASFRVLPWENGTAFFLLDLFKPDGAPLAISPRQVLRNVAARADELGYAARVAVEFEYFFFRESPQSARDKHYRDMIPLSPGMFGYSILRTSVHSDLAHDILDMTRKMEIELEGFHTETGPGVYETAIKYDDALRAADKAALFKTVVKILAQRHGLLATFMAKWNANLPGCSGHIHQSLYSKDGRRNLFYSSGNQGGMSQLMRAYMAGQCELMRDFAVMFCPTVNSYKRLVPGTWAPTNVTWGNDNRTTALRAIVASSRSTRVEHRLPGADANPYLSVAASLASGLHGINHEAKLSAPEQNAYKADAPTLPRHLEEAVAIFRSSAAAREFFGEEFVDHYAATRDWEARQYRKAVTDWELERYFEII
ncbi:MAG TPA: glutamine synthetase family protein [Terriglobia bacterium]|nr:glutamine synthetase family protein [Terriglobia bacterium]